MSAVSPSVVCERVRAQVSLQLDDELSELERRMLEAHLARCSECRSYKADLDAFTRELRSAPLQGLEHPVVVRRPRRVSLARVQVGVAAALALALLGAVTQLAGPEPERSTVRAPVRFESSRQLTREVQLILRGTPGVERDSRRGTLQSI